MRESPDNLGRTLCRLMPGLVFFGILLAPALWLGHPGTAPIKLAENRQLASFPKYSMRWLQEFEKWFGDHFGFRQSMIRFGTRYQVGWLGLSANRQVVIGKDGWLFYDEHYKAGRGQFAELRGRAPISSEQLRRATENLRAANSALRACAIDFYLVIAPNKESIYPEKLPNKANGAMPTWADQIVDAMRQLAPEVPVIDLRAALGAAKQIHSHDLYYKTDTHWNDLGAFVAYQDISGRLASDGIRPLSPHAQSGHQSIVSTPYPDGDIAVSMLSLPNFFDDHRLTLNPGMPRNAAIADRATGMPAPKDPNEFQAFANPSGHGVLLLYRDSFSTALIPFLAEDFKQLTAIASHQIDGGQVREARPSVVMLEIVERYLPNLAVSSKALGGICRK